MIVPELYSGLPERGEAEAQVSHPTAFNWKASKRCQSSTPTAIFSAPGHFPLTKALRFIISGFVCRAEKVISIF